MTSRNPDIRGHATTANEYAKVRREGTTVSDLSKVLQHLGNLKRIKQSGRGMFVLDDLARYLDRYLEEDYAVVEEAVRKEMEVVQA